MLKYLKKHGAGSLYILIGLSFAIYSTRYQIGTASAMGPGYFPLFCAVLLILVGVALNLSTAFSPNQDDQSLLVIGWRPLIYVSLSVVAFALSVGGIPSLGIPPVGLLIAIILLVVIASSSIPDRNIFSTLVLAGGLAIGCSVVFAGLLNMALPVFPEFLAG